MEARLNYDSIITQAQALAPWHFDFEIAPGVRTSDTNQVDDGEKDKQNVGIIDPTHLMSFFRKYYPDGLSGKDLVDVGCNSGGYCFLAAELGARKVVGFDIRDHWIEQAIFIKNIKFDRYDNIEFRSADAKSFIDSQGSVDIVIFKGVLYHLPDPIHVLMKLAEHAREAILVDTASSDSIAESHWAPIQEIRTHVMSGVDGLAWLPGGPAAIRPVLEYVGFRKFDVVYWQHETGHIGGGRFQVVSRR